MLKQILLPPLRWISVQWIYLLTFHGTPSPSLKSNLVHNYRIQKLINFLVVSQWSWQSCVKCLHNFGWVQYFDLSLNSCRTDYVSTSFHFVLCLLAIKHTEQKQWTLYLLYMFTVTGKILASLSSKHSCAKVNLMHVLSFSSDSQQLQSKAHHSLTALTHVFVPAYKHTLTHCYSVKPSWVAMAAILTFERVVQCCYRKIQACLCCWQMGSDMARLN